MAQNRCALALVDSILAVSIGLGRIILSDPGLLPAVRAAKALSSRDSGDAVGNWGNDRFGWLLFRARSRDRSVYQPRPGGVGSE